MRDGDKKLGDRLSLQMERLDILRKLNTIPNPQDPEQKAELEKLMRRNLEIMTELGYTEAEEGKMYTKEEEKNRGSTMNEFSGGTREVQ